MSDPNHPSKSYDEVHAEVLAKIESVSDEPAKMIVLRYKGVVLDSILEDRLVAETSQTSEGRGRVERLAADKRQLSQLLLENPQRPANERDQKVEALEQEV